MTYLRLISKIVLVSLTLFACSTLAVSALGIEEPYAWGENVGWLNWGTPEGAVDVPAGAGDLAGYVWGENIGWISLNCSNTASCGAVDYGVERDGGGELFGYAWGENVGWISFSCVNTASCGVAEYRVLVDEVTGVFSGYAWGENIGWLSMNCSNTASCGTVSYQVKTEDSPVSGGGSGATGQFIGTPTPTLTPTSSVPPATGVPPVPATPPPTTPPSGPAPTVTPPSLPPPIMPSGPAPTPPTQSPTAGPIIRVIQAIGNVIDRVGSVVFGPLEESCRGPLGSTACGVTALLTAAVVVGLLAAFMQNELAAAVFSLLQVIGIKKKARVWGVVYDAATKHAIPAAKLELLDVSGRVLEVRFTDRDGRYGFLTTPASLNQLEVRASIRVTKPGYRFPSSLTASGTDYVVYDNLYRGGQFSIAGDGLLNFSIPMDPTTADRARLNGFGHGLFGTFAGRLLALGFLVGLVAVPLNYYLTPTVQNLVILIIFFVVNAIRLALMYRPYGVTVDAVTGKKLPFALVTLLDEQGTRVGFTVSDEHGRYVLSAQRNRQYDAVAYTPANVVPQRMTRQRISRLSRMGRTAWVTLTLRV